MRRLTRLFLWLFVFSVPCGLETTIGGLGTITRLLGLMTMALGGATIATEGRLRKPGAIVWAAAIFAIVTFASLFWTISSGDTAEESVTYIQYVGLVFLISEFARTREEQHSLRLAFCLGALVFAADLLRNFALGIEIGGGNRRYSADFINPNFVGFILVMGLPMAWRLFLEHRGPVRVIASVYCMVAPLATMLTGSRSAFVALAVAASIIPLTLVRQSMRSLLQVAVIVIAAAVAVVGTMPEATWNRLSTTVEEFEGGTMSGRTDIWDRGWVAFLERPILGAGANAFGAATTPETRTQGSAHNMVLALLVEQGAFGLCVFGGLLLMCAWVIVGLPVRDRIIWVPAMLSWFIFAMLHDAHTDRVSWVVFGLLAAEGATRRHPEPAVRESRVPVSGAVAEQVAGHPAHLRAARSR